MAQFKTLTSRVMPLPVNDVDTDQIIPAQFLKVTDKNGLAEALFYHWRYNDDKSPKAEFVLNKPEFSGAQILLAGDNFGCGSSREHAPWALADFGFRAIIAPSAPSTRAMGPSAAGRSHRAVVPTASRPIGESIQSPNDPVTW